MKKQEIRHDPIRENIVKGLQYIQDNQGIVIKIFAVIILVIGGFSYYNHVGSIKIENAAQLTGLAQNKFINGDTDEALVKFERVVADYPGTPAAVQSLVYLLNDAVSNDDDEALAELLKEDVGTIEDPVVAAALYKLRGDVALNAGENRAAVKHYREAISITDGTGLQLKYQLDVASGLIALDNFEGAKEELDEILSQDNIGFNEKNLAEELLGFVNQILGI